MTEVFFIYFRFHSVIIKPELIFCNSKGMVTDMDGSFSLAGRFVSLDRMGDAGISAVAGFLYASSQLNYNDQ